MAPANSQSQEGLSLSKYAKMTSFRSASVIGFAIVLAYALGLVLLQDNDLILTAYGDTANFLINFGAAFCLLFAALNSRTSDRRVYLAWLLMAIGQFSYAIGDAIFAILEVILTEAPFPSIADLFYLLQYPIFLLGILFLPSILLKPADQLKMVLDTSIVLITAVLIFWILLIVPTIEASTEENIVTIVLAVAYPVMDLILLFALVELLFRKLSSESYKTLMTLAASIIFMLFADTAYFRLTLEDLYTTGNVLVDTSWVICFVLLGLAAVHHIMDTRKESQAVSIKIETHYGQITWPLYLPYICAAAAFFFLVWSHNNPLPISFSALSWVVGCIIGLVIVRQILALRENDQLYREAQQEIFDRKLAELEIKRLNEELESRVAERTKQLEKTNIELQNEIIDHKQAEIALRSSQRRLSDIINFLPDATLVIDDKGKIIAWNKAMEALTKIQAESMLGKDNFEYALPFYGERRPILIDMVLNYRKDMEDKYNTIKRLDDGMLIGEAYTTKLNDEGVYLFGSAAALYDIHGNIAGAIETISDITDRKLAEKELQKAKMSAEAAARAKSDFLANMSHEIRTPMNAVIGMTLLLLETDLTPEQRDHLETIWSSGEALLAIINDILDFSKIDGGKMKLEASPFDLRVCIEDSLDLIAGKASEKGLELAYLMDKGVQEWIVGDAIRLRQVLVNLLDNAVKFTDRGEIIVRTESTPSDNDKAELHFSVRDTGIGISKDNIRMLFNSFSQVDSSITRNYSGTGLGLAISKRLVELMGGRIWIESEIGKGSTFHFTIIAGEVESKVVHDYRSIPALAGKHILVVDDSDITRNIIKDLLTSCGMQSTEATSSSEVLNIIGNRRSFDIVLLDYELPDTNISTLIDEIRHGTKVPLVLMSSLGHSRSSDLPVQGWLIKPMKPLQLFNLLNKLLTVEKPSVRSSEPVPMVVGGQSDSNGLRILLAEDNLINQKVALSMLKYLGYVADVATDGNEVMEALEREPYDVILMDIQMPQMDGLEATHRIRSAGFKTWIIAMTAYAMDGDREMCIDAGMNDYISKPIKLDELRNALEKRASMPESRRPSKNLTNKYR
ncbi:MAG: response regulator [Methanotrichaceae archaeon]|nr:response regulator [Methanotrichaceae archaeon]